MYQDRFLIDFISTTLSKFFAGIGIIFFNFIIINFSNKDTLGILMMAISLIAFLSIFSKFGLNHASLRLASIYFEKKDKKAIIELILYVIFVSGIMSIIFTLIIFIFEKYIASELYNNIKLLEILKIFAVSLPFYTFIQIQKSLFKSFKLPALSNFSDIGSILFFCSLLVLISNYINLHITLYKISLFFLLSCILIFILNNLILFQSSKTNLVNVTSKSTIDLKKNLLKTLPDYFTIDFVNYTLVWGSIFICTFFYKPEIIGSFSSAYWFAYSLLFFPLILNSIYAPNFAINSDKNNKIKQKKIFTQNRNISLIITFPIFFIIFFFSDFFLNFFFEINSKEFVIILRILLINSMLRVIFGPQVLFLNMSNKQKKLKNISLICALFQIVLILISVIYFNLTVLSVAFLVSNLIKHIILKIELKNYLLN